MGNWVIGQLGRGVIGGHWRHGALTIPTKADWGGEPAALEAEAAFENFFGKSFEEAEAMFQANALRYQEDLIYMPAAAFNFYAPAFAAYVTSEQAEFDSDGASTFLGLVDYMLRESPGVLAASTLKLLVDAAGVVAHRPEFYDADEGIYGSFPLRYERILRLAEGGGG